MTKKAKTIDEQIDIYKSRGIQIEDEDKAREHLLDIGYFRLGFYLFPFEESYPEARNRNHICKIGTKLEDVVGLYYFDYDLRNILMRYINRVEVNLRTRIVHTMSIDNIEDPLWFVNRNVVSSSFVNSFDERVYEPIKKKSLVIQNHHRNHSNCTYAPAWKTIEYMTFGSLKTLYHKIKKQESKTKIAKLYGINSSGKFYNYTNTICFLRNLCAHGNVLFDMKTEMAISIGAPICDIDNGNKNSLYGAILVVNHVLSKISGNRAADMMEEINDLFDSQNDVVKEVLNRCSNFPVA